MLAMLRFSFIYHLDPKRAEILQLTIFSANSGDSSTSNPLLGGAGGGSLMICTASES